LPEGFKGEKIVYGSSRRGQHCDDHLLFNGTREESLNHLGGKRRLRCFAAFLKGMGFFGEKGKGSRGFTENGQGALNGGRGR